MNHLVQFCDGFMIYDFLTCNIWDFNATWLLSFLFVFLSARHFQFFLLFANVAIWPGFWSSFCNNLKNKKKRIIFDRKFTNHGHSAYGYNIKCQKCASIKKMKKLKKWKSWELFWSYQQNSTANPAHLPQNWTKLAKLAVLFSW